MSKHTPAPWKIVQREVLEDGSVRPSHIKDNKDIVICYLEGAYSADLAVAEPTSFWNKDFKTSANARLIEVSPVLLEAASEVRKMMKTGASQASASYTPTSFYLWLAKLDLAIAKAEGTA